jgi:predicted transposase/invertase (TIGR01784 family)
MENFLRKRGSEVLNMLNMEFKLEDALAVRFEEGLEEGLEKGIEKGLEKGKFEVARSMLAEGFPAEIIKKCTGIDENAILSLW